MDEATVRANEPRMMTAAEIHALEAEGKKLINKWVDLDGKIADMTAQRLEALNKIAHLLTQLKEQKANRLHKVGWSQYVKQMFGFGDDRVGQILKASQVIALLMRDPDVSVMPRNERQVRPLVGSALPDEEKIFAWKNAVAASGGWQPTGKTVRTVVKAVEETAGMPQPKRTKQVKAITINARVVEVMHRLDSESLDVLIALQEAIGKLIDKRSKLN